MAGVSIGFVSTAAFSFIRKTQAAPMISETPAIVIMRYSGASCPGVLSIESIQPPTIAATICGMQMVQLNRPRYAPMLPPLSL